MADPINASLIDAFVDGYSLGKAGEQCDPPGHFTSNAQQEWIIGWEYGAWLRELGVFKNG